jgi:hypothetical protein
MKEPGAIDTGEPNLIDLATKEPGRSVEIQ